MVRFVSGGKTSVTSECGRGGHEIVSGRKETTGTMMSREPPSLVGSVPRRWKVRYYGWKE